MNGGDGFFSDMPMLELFRIEMEQQASTLFSELLKLEKDSPDLIEHLANLMRAAHSIKGASRLVGRSAIVNLSHVLEDCFVQAQSHSIVFQSGQIDVLLATVDVLQSMAKDADSDEEWLVENEKKYDGVISGLRTLFDQLCKDNSNESSMGLAVQGESPEDFIETAKKADGEDDFFQVFCEVDDQQVAKTGRRLINRERVLRISSRQLDRLMALTGEFMVQSRCLRPYTDSLRSLKREQADLVTSIEELKEQLRGLKSAPQTLDKVIDIQQRAVACRDTIDARVADLDAYDVRGESLSSRLRVQVISSRMRPFRDGVQGLSRIVRDVARLLGKEIELQMSGLETLVDRDILERLEAPLSHLINNAIDHGIESPETRKLQGKREKGTISLSAFHHGGMLYILVQDDGKGLDFEQIRNRVLQRGLVKEDVAKNLTQQELGEFLFLPGFSTKDEVTSLSGRGVGLDVVQDVTQEMRGGIEVSSQLGSGTEFKMRFPLTLSVVPSLLVEIGEEPYAFPLARLDQIFRVSQSEITERNGIRYLNYAGEEIELVCTASMLELVKKPSTFRAVSVLVLATRDAKYGYVVDRFLKESELVVQVLPNQVERIQDIAAVALMDDGMPVFIIDVDDLLRSTKKAIENRDHKVDESYGAYQNNGRRRILIVDDSITVREIERKLLISAGYEVEVAVDGMDGWNAIRNNLFDLIVTDVDMPRLNGLQLLSMIKQDLDLKSIPVIVVSYKDRQEDQENALNLGADLFIAKANFHDETFKDSVAKLIGTGR